MDTLEFQRQTDARLARLEAAADLPPFNPNERIYINGMSPPDSLGRVRSEFFDTVILPKYGAELAARDARADGGPNAIRNDDGQFLHLATPGPLFYMLPALETFPTQFEGDAADRVRMNCAASFMPEVGFEGFAWKYPQGAAGNRGTMLPGTTSLPDKTVAECEKRIEDMAKLAVRDPDTPSGPFVPGEDVPIVATGSVQEVTPPSAFAPVAELPPSS